MMKATAYLGIRSIIECPIMDDRKWSKVPDIPADAFLVDLEDSVPPPLKDAARSKVLEYLSNPDYFGGRLLIARPNHLSTRWGRDDLAALGEAGVTCLAYPKCQSVDELLEVQSILRSHGADPDLFGVIETARSVLEVAGMAAIERVVAVGLGVGDLGAELGIPLYEDDGELNRLFLPAKVQVSLSAAAYGCLATDFTFAPDLRDLDDVRRRLVASRKLGFTTSATFYPPHVEVINEVFTPSSEALARADEVIGLYEAAVAAGSPAVSLDGGRALLVHDYDQALKVRARHAAVAR